MVKLSRRGFARLALMSGLCAPAGRSAIATVTASEGSSLAIPQPPSSAMHAPDANPPSEEGRWNRNGFRSARAVRKLRITPE